MNCSFMGMYLMVNDINDTISKKIFRQLKLIVNFFKIWKKYLKRELEKFLELPHCLKI